METSYLISTLKFEAPHSPLLSTCNKNTRSSYFVALNKIWGTTNLYVKQRIVESVLEKLGT